MGPVAGMNISWHAMTRWQQRVEPTSSTIEARWALLQFASLGRVRPTPRHWTTVKPVPGLSFIYWSGRPGVCALIWGNTIVTVLTRTLCTMGRRSILENEGTRRSPSKARYLRVLSPDYNILEEAA